MKVILLSHTENADDLAEIAARSCYSKKGASEISPTPNRNPLINAIDSGHESVLEHATYTFSIEGISRVCSHQLVRHRVASYSQQSQRYAEAQKRYYTPDNVPKEYKDVMDKCIGQYSLWIADGVPEEDARYILPGAIHTNVVVTMNARTLRHFFNLRLCERAQKEIREVAESMYEICKVVSPVIFDGCGPSCVRLGYCPEGESCGKMGGGGNYIN